MFERIAILTTTRPRLVLALWLLVLLASIPGARRVGDVVTTDPGAAPGGVGTRVQALLRSEFATQENAQLLLLAQPAADRGDAAEAAAGATGTGGLRVGTDALVAQLLELPSVESVRSAREDGSLPSLAAGDAADLVLLNLTREASAGDTVAVVDEIRALLPRDSPLDFLLTGGPAVERELQEISKRDALRAELIGVPVSMAILIVVFGAVVAALLPLAVALTSITASLALFFLVGLALPMAAFGQIVISMLGLATGIDYALLMVNRFREELADGLAPREAAHATTVTAGKAVVFSGLTVVIALSALLVPPLMFVRSMGIASILVMLLSVAVSVTSLPALLTLLGPRVNALQVTRRDPGSRSRTFWRRWAERVLERPWMWTTVGVLFLLLLALPALRMQVAFSSEQGLTAETDVSQAQAVLTELGLDGLLRSYDLLLDLSGRDAERGFFNPSSVQAVARLTRELAAIPEVERVVSPTTAGSLPSLLVYQYYATPETARNGPLAALADATVSGDGRRVLVRVFPRAGLSPAELGEVAAAVNAAARKQRLQPLLGGNYVIEGEWARALYRYFPLAVGLVYLATFVLLALAFRSLLIPIKTIILNTLTVGTAFGVITLVFQFGIGARLFGLEQGLGFVETSVPIFIFAIVFGLSMDYEVFLLARVLEAHQRGDSDREAVIHALSATGGVITSAALIMIAVFSVFMMSDVVLIKTLALGLTVAVLLDATLVRSVLVPAVMALAGKWNWKIPRPMARLVARLDLTHD